MLSVILTVPKLTIPLLQEITSRPSRAAGDGQVIEREAHAAVHAEDRAS